MGTMGPALMLIATAGVAAARDGFDGAKAGEVKIIAGVWLCWCPPGTCAMGSPPEEPERRPSDETVRDCLALQDAQVVPYFLHVRARRPS
jgi:hypothetical protein